MDEAAEWIGEDTDLWQVWRELRGIEECIRAEGALLTGKSVGTLRRGGRCKVYQRWCRPKRRNDLYHEEDFQAVREDGDLPSGRAFVWIKDEGVWS